MNFIELKSDRNKKIVSAVGVVLLVVVLAFAVYSMYSFFKLKPLKLSLSDSQIAPGEETTLMVHVRNTGPKVLEDLLVEVEPTDFSTVTVEPPNGRQISILGSGEFREVTFSIKVSESALPGSYGVNVAFDNGDRKVNEKIYFRVS
ncbi:MAG: hypothetical protein J7K00_02150 [Candidatus Diapherotrites archaeon]|nr:hypothetical protein [Candidatus Diapherotrites archaeon]